MRQGCQMISQQCPTRKLGINRTSVLMKQKSNANNFCLQQTAHRYMRQTWNNGSWNFKCLRITITSLGWILVAVSTPLLSNPLKLEPSPIGQRYYLLKFSLLKSLSTHVHKGSAAAHLQQQHEALSCPLSLVHSKNLGASHLCLFRNLK